MSTPSLPYKIACLCELTNEQGDLLLLHRSKHPNKDLYSPIGGKLEQATGESPAQCAQREIQEETGLEIPIERLRLSGIISETAYQNETHWLMFWYRVEGPVDLPAHEMDEGSLEWHPADTLMDLPLPSTDRDVIWPAVMKYHDGFFALHIDCTGPEMTWTIEQTHGT